MENNYRFSVRPENNRLLHLDKNGQIAILYHQPNHREEYDFIGEPDQAARELARRVELYNREHLEKLVEVETDYTEYGMQTRQS